MANPRYEQQQPQSSRQRKLAEMMQLVGLQQALNGNPQESRALAGREQQARVAQAMAMMGMMQQQQEAQAMQAYRQQQLEQTSEANRGQQQHYAAMQTQQQGQNDIAANRNYVDAVTLMGQPGVSPLVRESFRNRPGFEQISQSIDALNAQDRAALMQTLPGQLKSITEPGAREAHGRVAARNYPGLYEEALSVAYPPQAEVIGPPAPPAPTFFSEREGGIASFDRPGVIIPYLQKTGILPTIPDAAKRAAIAQELWDAPDSPISLLFGRKKKQPTP